MGQRDFSGIIGGALLIAIGLFVAQYSAEHYTTGSLRRMGPGFLPLVLGLVLAGLGFIILVPAFFRPGKLPSIDSKSAIFVLGSIVIFGLLLPRFGLIVATFCAVLTCLIPDPKLTRRGKALTAVTISTITYLIFITGLRMNLMVWPLV